MFCPNCGKSNNSGARFCAVCGSKLPQTNSDPVNPIHASANPAHASVDAQGVVRNITKSLPYLLTAIMFSISAVFLLLMFLDYDIIMIFFESSLPYAIPVYISILIVFILPLLLTICGLWTQYTSATNASRSLTASGITYMMIGQISAIFSTVLLFIYILIGVGKIIESKVNSYVIAPININGFSFDGTKGISEEALEKLKADYIYLAVIGSLIVIILMIYFVEWISLFIRVKGAVKHGTKDNKQPIYLYIVSFLLAVCFIYISTQVFEEFTLWGILSLVNAAGFLLSLFTAFHYTSKMNQIIQ